ncbi:MAG: DsbA family protein [Pseudomonadota bacterium]
MVRLISRTLLGLLVLVPAIAVAQGTAGPTDLDEADRQKLRAEIRAYLLENPEVLVEALGILEDRRALEAEAADKALIAANKQNIFNDGHSFVGGNPDGDVTLVEFLDYRCGFCKQAHPQIVELLEADPNVRLVVKEFPILGPESVAAGRMAIAAAAIDNDRYEALNDALMNFPSNLTERAAYQIAASVGYDPQALRAEADSDATTEKLEANYELARAMGLNGTPSFILEDEIIRGLLPAPQMQALIDEKRRAIKSQSN